MTYKLFNRVNKVEWIVGSRWVGNETGQAILIQKSKVGRGKGHADAGAGQHCSTPKSRFSIGEKYRDASDLTCTLYIQVPTLPHSSPSRFLSILTSNPTIYLLLCSYYGNRVGSGLQLS